MSFWVKKIHVTVVAIAIAAVVVTDGNVSVLVRVCVHELTYFLY